MFARIGGWIGSFLDMAGGWLAVYFKADASPYWHPVLITLIVAVILLGSAFLSATVAEMTGHKIKIHFLLGLVCPYIYPILLSFRIKRVERKEEAAEEIEVGGESYSMTAKLINIQEEKAMKRAEKHGTPLPGDIAAITDEETSEAVAEEPATEPTEAVAEPANSVDRYYMESLSVDSSGNRAGPFKLELKDGSTLLALSIKGIQDELAVFEIDVRGDAKSIRIKYSNIELCQKLN